MNNELVKQNLNNYKPIFNPLIKALDSGNLEKVEILIDHGAFYDNKMGLVHKAIEYGHSNILNYLVNKKGLDINYLVEGKNALSITFKNRKYDILKDCINWGADIHAKVQGKTLLEEILSANIYIPEDIFLLELLLKRGANPCELKVNHQKILDKLKNEAMDNLIKYHEAYSQMNHHKMIDNFNEELAFNILHRDKQKSFKDFSSFKDYKTYFKKVDCLKQVVFKVNEIPEVMSLKDQVKWYLHDEYPQILNGEKLLGELPTTLVDELKYDFQG
ncbi:MAG: ankyrin repeat domain-containing protein [Rickettsia endosymbiont of Graphium doson]|nr:ankyrin repeat domain-containing protein [Rickettsia endosymbiont of Graphium doson]